MRRTYVGSFASYMTNNDRRVRINKFLKLKFYDEIDEVGERLPRYNCR